MGQMLVGLWSLVGSAGPTPGAHGGEARVCFRGAQEVSWYIFPAIGEGLQERESSECSCLYG